MLPPNTTTYAAVNVEKRSRLTTFFRGLLVIPHLIVLALWGFVAFFAVIVAWFALLFTARYPAGLYNFLAGFSRYTARVYGYYYLLADPYPPFNGDEHPEYPVVLQIGPPLAHYSRLLVFFRLILLIPVYIVLYVLSIVAGVVVILNWLVIVVLGRLPEGLHSVVAFCQSYQARSTVYALLLTEAFPPFDGSPESAVGSTPGASAGEPPVPPATVDGIGDPPR